VILPYDEKGYGPAVLKKKVTCEGGFFDADRAGRRVAAGDDGP
jgi:hypothetical protein